MTKKQDPDSQGKTEIWDWTYLIGLNLFKVPTETKKLFEGGGRGAEMH